MEKRTDLIRKLTALQRKLDHGAIMIDAQQRVITSLTARGDNVTDAITVLTSFEEEQDRRLEEIGRLLKALDKIPLI